MRAGTLMIEPTESESKQELDRLVNALISIRGEIRDIEEGRADKADNVLKNAPHTAEEVLKGDADWSHPYSRQLVPASSHCFFCFKEDKQCTAVLCLCCFCCAPASVLCMRPGCCGCCCMGESWA